MPAHIYTANELVAIIKNTQEHIAEYERILEANLKWLSNPKNTEASRSISQHYKPTSMMKNTRDLKQMIERYNKDINKYQYKLIKLNL